jgi:flagellin-like hook-associated protein FlgL
MTVINSNPSAMLIAQSMASKDRSIAESMERLSTGRRINSASDDAAGLAIATKMTSQVRGLDQAARNVNNASSMVQLADGAAAQISDIYQRMREIAIQAADGSNSTQDIEVLNVEFKQAAAEVDRIVDSTQFNGKNLLDGSVGGVMHSTSVSFQVGANAGQTLDVDFGDLNLNTPDFLVGGSSDVQQIGADIIGDADDDEFGTSVTLSGDGLTMAIGGPFNDDSGSNSGHVQIWRRVNDSWVFDTEIDGVGGSDKSGSAISLSYDGSTLAIGAANNDDGPGSNSGHVRVFRDNGATWQQLGSAILGEASGDLSGSAVSLSADGNTVAIGAPDNDDNGGNSGHVRVFENIAGTWTQVGIDIDGEATGDVSGSYVAISADASIVAVGAHANDSNGQNSGHVRIYQDNGGTWTSIGEITGVAAADLAGAVSLSSDGRTIAVGARENDDGPGNNSGHVRIFNYDGSSWNQVGDAILGSADSDHSGYSVALSGDGKTVAIGAKDHDDGANDNAGEVRVYHNENGIWTLVTTHTGSAGSDEFGVSVALSDDGRTLAAGAWQVIGSNPGYVRAFQLAPDLSTLKTTGMGTGNDINTTIERLDQLITNVATQRATFGSQLNRLSYAVDNLASSALATDAARGRIEDANYATETTALARSQIIAQAGTAMLAQANLRAQSVLDLLL